MIRLNGGLVIFYTFEHLKIGVLNVQRCKIECHIVIVITITNWSFQRRDYEFYEDTN